MGNSESSSGSGALAQEENVGGGKNSRGSRAHQQKLRFSYKEQKEWDTIEDDIEKLENRLEALEADIAASATNYGKLNELMKEKEEAEAALEEKMERWEYLSELAERIANQ